MIDVTINHKSITCIYTVITSYDTMYTIFVLHVHFYLFYYLTDLKKWLISYFKQNVDIYHLLQPICMTSELLNLLWLYSHWQEVGSTHNPSW